MIVPETSRRLNQETQEDWKGKPRKIVAETPRRLYQKPQKIELGIPRRLNQKPQEDWTRKARKIAKRVMSNELDSAKVILSIYIPHFDNIPL